MSTYNLAYYPRIWFDEGVLLDAAKTLAQTGYYGTQSVDGIKLFDNMITTGPTVIAPVALTFKLLNVGLVQGRLIAVIYLLVAALGLYRVAVQMYGRNIATVAVLVFASLGESGPFANGRYVLGEVAALAYLFWGASLFISAQQARRTPLFLGAGLLLGLSILTKNQFVVLGFLLVGIWLATRTEPGGLSARNLVLMLAGLAAPSLVWFGYQFAVLGPDGFGEQLRGMFAQAGVSGIVGPFRRTQYSVRLLLSSSAMAWCLAGLLYVWLSSIQNGSRRPERLLLLAFATVWLSAYVLVSIEWARYSVAAIVTSSLFVAKLMCDLAVRYGPWKYLGGRPTARLILAEPLGTALVLVMAIAVGSGIFLNGWEIARTRDDSPQRFADLVADDVPPGVVVESMEWEISFLSDRTFHRPPVDVIVAGVKLVFLGAPPDSLDWYHAPLSASYIAAGPMAKWIGLYKPQIRRGEYTLVGTAGEYDLYRRSSV